MDVVHDVVYNVVYDKFYTVVYDILYTVEFESNFASLQAVGRRGRGRHDINIHLLKQARFRPEPGCALPTADCDGVMHDDVLDQEPAWMSYEFRTVHLVLRWLPTKLAEWISANLSEETLTPNKVEDKWTAAELNDVLFNNVVQATSGSQIDSQWSSVHVWC